MTILDRYLLNLFVRIFAVCFLSFSGLFVVIHLFSNLDELTALANSEGGWPNLLQAFYLPRLADIFDKTAAMLALVSAIFALSLMQRRREVTAIQAAGLPLRRVLRPVLIFSLLIVVLTACNRELLLPKFRSQLVRTAQDWSGESELPMTVQDDWRTGVRLRGSHLVMSEQTIYQPDVQLPHDVQWTSTTGETTDHIRAETAKLEPGTDDRPAGLLLSDVSHPEAIDSLRSVTDGKHFAVLTSADQPWLQARQCFVACDFDLETMAFGNKLDQFRTFPELMSEVRQPQTAFGRSDRLALHSRLMKPLLDCALILLGLPIVLSQTDRNVFVSAGICMLVIGLFHLGVTASHSLGNYRLIQPAALAAWLPLMVFGPLAVVSLRKLGR